MVKKCRTYGNNFVKSSKRALNNFSITACLITIFYFIIINIMLSSCQYEHVGNYKNSHKLRAGDYLSNEFIDAVVKSKSPFKSFKNTSNPHYVIVEDINNATDKVLLKTVYGLHEGGADFVLTSDKKLKVMTDAGFNMANLSFELIDDTHFTLGFDKYDVKSYSYVGNIDDFLFSRILTGIYNDEKGQIYIFDNSGNAIFPDRTFKYRIGLDFAVETPNSDYFYDITFNDIYAYKFINNKLEIYRTKGEANNEIDTYPILRLFISVQR